jgi:hypothetical protein
MIGFEFEEGSISASIATPETDAALRETEFLCGMQAKLAGSPSTDCPWKGGMCEMWWMEGWNSIEIE